MNIQPILLFINLLLILTIILSMYKTQTKILYHHYTQMRRLTHHILSTFCHKPRPQLSQIPTLKTFLRTTPSSFVQPSQGQQQNRLSFHIETYGCQMNENDSEIVRSLLKEKYVEKQKIDADIVLLNTCAIREAAEEKIYQRINQLKKTKVVGVLGCMAQRLKEKMFQNGVHIVCGPDSYRDLPRLVDLAINDEKSINVQLSAEETYADITPVRKNLSNISAFLSIMRGCNNMCSFCIVPWVRGRERSRDFDTIMKQIEGLSQQGVKQITFLGQNVNSYHETSKTDFHSEHKNSQGFSQTFKLRNIPGMRFEHLLEQSAKAFPNIRFRFTSPHPKDFPQNLLETMAKYNNISNHIHLPAQSGSSFMLERMRRNHTRQSYLNLVSKIRSIIPNVGLTTDLICGFCGETEEHFQDTLKLIEEVRYDQAFLFAYSMREKTHAHRRYTDDVPEEVKKDRLKRMIQHFEKDLASTYAKQLGNLHLVLIEKTSKRDQDVWVGKTDNFKKGYLKRHQKLAVLKKGEIKQYRQSKVGDFVIGQVVGTKSRSLQCENIAIAQTINDFYEHRHMLEKIKEQRKEEREKQASLRI